MTLPCNRGALRLKNAPAPAGLKRADSNQQFFESAMVQCSGQKHCSSIIGSDDLADPPRFRNKDNGFLSVI